MSAFRTSQIEALASSGWSVCPSIAQAVIQAGLPPVTKNYLDSAFSPAQWEAAEAAVAGLRDRFGAARFAEEVTYGLVLVPDPDRLDTRGPVSPATRRDQLGTPTADVVDRRLPAGRLGIVPGRAWTPVATASGQYGIALGSYRDITSAAAEKFAVDGTDTRELMIRQVWGARVLQGGQVLPDCEANKRWTFTLFPGEELIDGLAASGTVLKGKVRFRLGKPDRGIGPARVAPAVAVV